MKNQDKKRLNVAIELLIEIKTCPDEFDSKRQNNDYCNSIECKKCWFDFINFKLKQAKS